MNRDPQLQVLLMARLPVFYIISGIRSHRTCSLLSTSFVYVKNQLRFSQLRTILFRLHKKKENNFAGDSSNTI